MNTQFRNYYIASMIIMFGLILFSLFILCKDLLYIIQAVSSTTYKGSLNDLLRQISFEFPIIVVFINIFASYLHSRIGPQFKPVFMPTCSAMTVYLFSMMFFYIRGFLTDNFLILSATVFVVFAIVTFKEWSTELNLYKEFNAKKISIFEADDTPIEQVQAEKKTEEDLTSSFGSIHVTQSIIDEVYKNRSNALIRPLNFFVQMDLPFSLLMNVHPDPKVFKRLKLLSRLSMLVRVSFISQILLVIIYFFKYGHSISFAIANLSGPFFWLTLLIVLNFKYHSTVMLYVSPSKYESKVKFRIGLFYFALFGSLLCTLINPNLTLVLMSSFYLVSSWFLGNSLEKSFRKDLNERFIEN